MSQRVLVIGGAGGIGSALARLIVAAGGRVFLAGRDQVRLETLGAELGVPFGTVVIGRCLRSGTFARRASSFVLSTTISSVR